MRTRIAFLVSRFPKFSETFILDEIRALEARGLDVRVCSFLREREPMNHPDAARLAERCLVLGECTGEWLPAQLYWLLRRPRIWLEIWVRTLLGHRRDRARALRAVVALAHAMVLARRMMRDDVGHLHAHWATHTALAAWAAHRLTRIPYSFTTHADDLYLDPPMLEEKVREAKFVVTISEFNRRLLAKRLGDWSLDRVRVIHCGISLAEFPPMPPAEPGTRFTVVCVARLELKKGHGVLLDACAKLLARGIPIRCRLVGDGAERGALEALIASLGLGDSVELLGRRSREEVREILASAHVVVLPGRVLENGRADGIPVALMEALAIERPVVASRITGIPELVETGVTGLLVEPGDPAALARALERLREDPELARRLAVAGRRRVEEGFDVHRNVASLAALVDAAARSEGAT
jgi:colanic acid/amylovoran biosynthesis glycosyltransferase